MFKQKKFILGIHGTKKIIGLGTAGNILLVCRAVHEYSNVFIDFYTKGHCISYDKEYENDTGIVNPFEYYFNQQQDRNYEIMSFSQIPNEVLYYAQCNNLNSTEYNNVKRNFYKNFSLKDHLLKKINDLHAKFKGTTLGIQMRTSDMISSGATNKNIDYYISKTHEICNQHSIQTIFIATDNNSAIQKFIDEFPINIIYQEGIERTDSNLGPHDRINCEEEIYSTRKYHNYLCGEEVLIDIFSLTKTDYILRSHSAVSDVAIILSENIKVIFT
jgi:hypothetical protein